MSACISGGKDSREIRPTCSGATLLHHSSACDKNLSVCWTGNSLISRLFPRFVIPERGSNVPVLVRVIEDSREGRQGADNGGADEGKKEGEGDKAPLKDEEVSSLCQLLLAPLPMSLQ